MPDAPFTPRAENVLRLAQRSSAGLGHGYVGSEHLLLGLLREEQGAAGRMLTAAGVRLEAVRGLITQLVGVGFPGALPAQGLTPHCKQSIELATLEAGRLGRRTVDTEHLLLGLLQVHGCVAQRVLTGAGQDPRRLYTQVLASLGGEPAAYRQSGRPREREMGESKFLEQYARNLTRMAAAGELDPVLEREEEIRRLVLILSRRSKHNPALLGEAGVGKTAVVEGLAQRIAARETPECLWGKRILMLDLAAAVAGTKYRGEFEERIRAILAEVRRAGDIILFLDEMHTLLGAGSAEGAIDAANLLKPALGRGEVQIIGATTLDEYRRYIEKDPALSRRFQPVLVAEPSPRAALSILTGLRGRYEAHHKLTISDEALEAAVTLSRRYLPDRFLPDKAIDLMDEAASHVRLEHQSPSPDQKRLEARARRARQEMEAAVREQDFETAARLKDAHRDFLAQWERSRSCQAPARVVTAQDVAAVVAGQTGIPVTELTREESRRLLGLEEELARRLVGQEEAVRAVATAIRLSRVGLGDPKRPVGVFLFLGPTGVGKTELCRALAQTLFGSEQALLRFDMSEYMEAHTVSRLVGSPPGYVGHEEGGQLTERVRRQPYCILLFDELEKAHSDVWSLLLQIMEEGVLTDAQGRKSDFRNAVIVMTSNIGARQISLGGSRLGFACPGPGEHPDHRVSQAVMEEVKRTFRPEFLNRIDETVVFHPLSPAQLTAVAARLLAQVEKRLESRGIALRLGEGTADAVARLGFDPHYGARPLRRVIRARLESPAARLILQGSCQAGDTLHFFQKNGELFLENLVKGQCEPSGEHETTMNQEKP